MPGDVVAFMCHAERTLSLAWLEEQGAEPLTPEALRLLAQQVSAG